MRPLATLFFLWALLGGCARAPSIGVLGAFLSSPSCACHRRSRHRQERHHRTWAGIRGMVVFLL